MDAAQRAVHCPRTSSGSTTMQAPSCMSRRARPKSSWRRRGANAPSPGWERSRIGCTSRRCGRISRFWYKVVVWLSTLACVLAVLGLVLAFTQAPSFYRSWMRWHYIVGAVFGVFVLTWAFSGLLSMEPYAWTNARGLDLNEDALTGGPTELAAFGGVGAAGLAKAAGNRDIKEVGSRADSRRALLLLLATDSAPAERSERANGFISLTSSQSSASRRIC